MGAPLINPSQHRQLFLDDHAVEKMHGVKRALHQPLKAEPVLMPDHSLDQVLLQSLDEPQWNSEKKVWEWWYRGVYAIPPYGSGQSTTSSMTHYATSTDGISWEAPSLGLYSWRGSTDNNIAFDSVEVEFIQSRERSPCHIFRDERDEDPQRRYKGFFNDEQNCNRWPAVSQDGFHWTVLDVPPVPSNDTSDLAYDEIGDQYVATVKHRTEWGRSVWLSTSRDFANWTPPRLIVHTDEIDKQNRRDRVRRVVEDPAYLSPPVVDATDYSAELYMMSVMPYEGIYVGFPLLFNPAGTDAPQMNNTGINQVELAVSRDLHRWERVADRSVFLGVEPWNGVNYGTAQVSVCGRPIVHEGREIWVYYQACRFRGHHSLYEDVSPEFLNDMGGIFLARLRLDGFVSLDAEQEGEVVTRPFMLNGEDLYVNAEADSGELRAEILDAETMDPLPGFSASQCASIRGDHLSGRIAWEGESAPVRDRPVRIRFVMRCAKLYSFWLD